jgi:site-specific DNA-cytosine methylase
MTPSRRHPKVLSVFSGLGGMDLGLEAAGFQTIGCIEKDETARQSLVANRNPRWPLLEPGDVSRAVASITPASVGLQPRQLAILAGGPPCQPFSKAAQWSDSARAGLSDPRSHCVRDFLTLAGQFLPRVILMENVAGFTRGDVSALPEIEVKLSGINREHGTSYRIQCRILNASDYGVPQHRERAILIAMRDGEEFAWPSPTHNGNPTRAWDAIGLLRSGTAPPRASGKWAGLLPSIPEGQNYLFHTRHGDGRPLFGYRTRYWSFLLKLAKDKPSWTLQAHPGPSTGPFHWENRPLTIPEMLRLQSFPGTWRVRGDYRRQVRQVGDATPPLLAEIIGRELGKQLFNLHYELGPVHHISRRRQVPGATAVRRVPARYRRLEGQHADHAGPGKGPKPRSAEPST